MLEMREREGSDVLSQEPAREAAVRLSQEPSDEDQYWQDPQVRQGGLASFSRRRVLAEFRCTCGDGCAAVQERKRDHTVAESQRQRQSSFQNVCRCCCLIQFSVVRDSQTLVDQRDGVVFMRGLVTWRQRLSRATRGGGESGRRIRPQHAKQLSDQTVVNRRFTMHAGRVLTSTDSRRLERSMQHSADER